MQRLERCSSCAHRPRLACWFCCTQICAICARSIQFDTKNFLPFNSRYFSVCVNTILDATTTNAEFVFVNCPMIHLDSAQILFCQIYSSTLTRSSVRETSSTKSTGTLFHLIGTESYLSMYVAHAWPVQTKQKNIGPGQSSILGNHLQPKFFTLWEGTKRDGDSRRTRR